MDQSSESDDDRGNRHDRFKSERFENSQMKNSSSRSKEKHERQTHKYSSRKNGRSPEIGKKQKDNHARSSSSRYESRSRHDKKYDNYHDSKGRKADTKKTDPEKVTRNKDYIDEKSTSKTKKSLSSLLKNFDKKVELKQKQPDIQGDIKIYQDIQPHLEKMNEKNDDKSVEISIGPSLPPNMKVGDTVFQTDINERVKEQGENNAKVKSIDTSNCFHNSKIKLEDETADLVTESYGPALPVKLKDVENVKSTTSCDTHTLKNDVPDEDKTVSETVIESNEDNSSYGPALPPSLKRDTIQGPTLPAGVSTIELEKMAQDDSEDDVVGPLPEGTMNITQYQLDLRALELKKQLEEEKSGSSNKIKKREEWMLELPPGKAVNLGLGPRTFRKRDGPDMSDRSSWTDTPADKLRKEELAAKGVPIPVNTEDMARMAFVKERDEAMDKIAEKNKKQEPESLLEMHQKKLKKKKKKEENDGKKQERRPFDRNIDLQVNRFDDAQKKAIFKKARLLGTRFSTGESKYL